MKTIKKPLVSNEFQSLPQQPFLKNVPIIFHNISDKTNQMLQIEQNFQLVCFGNEYNSVAAIISVYSELFEHLDLGKLELLKAAKDLGIDILTAVQGTDIDLRDETVYFHIFGFESWLEINGNSLKPSSWKYIPYLAVRSKNDGWESREAPLIKLK